MNRSDKIIFGIILGTGLLILFSLVAFTIGFYFFKEESIPYFFAAGLLAGGIADILFLKKLIGIVFDLPDWLSIGFYIVANIFIYGMFMGFPVFNLLMGIIAGYYTGRRIIYNDIISPQRDTLIKKAPLFTAFIMVLICFTTAFLVLREKTIGEELQGMLRLAFVPSKALIVSGTILGGLTLIIIQYFLTRIVLIRSLKAFTD